MFRIGKPIKIESKISGFLGVGVTGEDGEGEKKRRAAINEHRISSGGDKTVLKLIVVMVAQLCEYIKNR